MVGFRGAHVVTLALLFASVMAEGSCDTVSGGRGGGGGEAPKSGEVASELLCDQIPEFN